MKAETADTTFSSKWVNLAEERVGTKVLFANDDFFAEKENLIKPGRGVFIPDKYTDRGKWMDGWESRRKRTPGNDFCIVRLGMPGVLKGVDIDTNHFLGNHPPHASIEACRLPPGQDPDFENHTGWIEVLPKVALQPGSQNLFPISSPETFTHVRLQIYPDGGVARLRVYGEVAVDWSAVSPSELIDLVAVQNGGKVIECNDMFFGPKDNLIMPGRGINMGDGWETKRRRSPGFDWVTLALGHPGTVERIEVDTAHFKGNYPDRCALLGRLGDAEWKTLLPETKLQPDHQHYFDEKHLEKLGPISHIQMRIFPDGGVSRLRCWGRITPGVTGSRSIQEINALSKTDALAFFNSCCASSTWAMQMNALRPFASEAEMISAAKTVWEKTSEADQLEAFAGHPKIGDLDSLKKKFANTKAWASAEQNGVSGASEKTLRALQELNNEYASKFGFIFIVCATGKSADEMLAILQKRIKNSRAEELKNASREQLEITLLRLRK